MRGAVTPAAEYVFMAKDMTALKLLPKIQAITFDHAVAQFFFQWQGKEDFPS